MSLAQRLKDRIALDGPMTVAAYMTACLHDPEGGYYATRPRLGADGDFITAPLVSQMFGELLGLWVAAAWEALGRPDRTRLVELGPGDGTLMSDALRAMGRVAGLLDGVELWLVDPSDPLRALASERLGPRVEAHWATSLAQVPAGPPIILLANEVLDCLPARQFVRAAGGWAERRVGLDGSGELIFGLAPLPSGLALPAEAPEGAVLELSDAQAALGAELGGLVAAEGGAALLIDYGRDAPGYGDTLQALRRHRKVSLLEAPGEVDLTMHADFPSVAAAARAAGAETSPIVGQGAFLRALGAEVRAAALSRANPGQAAAIARQLHRLSAPEEMGALFKVLAIHQKGLTLPGFEAP